EDRAEWDRRRETSAPRALRRPAASTSTTREATGLRRPRQGLREVPRRSRRRGRRQPETPRTWSFARYRREIQARWRSAPRAAAQPVQRALAGSTDREEHRGERRAGLRARRNLRR